MGFSEMPFSEAFARTPASGRPSFSPITRVGVFSLANSRICFTSVGVPYGAKKRPRLGRCWSSLPSSLRLCRLRCSSSSSRSLAG